MKTSLKKTLTFFQKNYFFLILLSSFFFIGFFSFWKTFFAKPTYIYAKVQISQGLWWTQTNRSPVFFIKNLKTGLEEKNFLGETIAQVLSVRYYPLNDFNLNNPNQHDIYLLIKLKVNKSKTNHYNFKRSNIAVGSPVDFEFPQIQFSGTIIDLSETPFKDNLVEKIIYLEKPYGYSWEADQIKINDYYFDGQEKVFQIIDKNVSNNINSFNIGRFLTNNFFVNPEDISDYKLIKIKAKIKLKKEKNYFIFGEEQIIKPGGTLNIETNNFYFQDYLITNLE